MGGLESTEVDYGKTVSQVYCDIARFMIQRLGDCRVLSLRRSFCGQLSRRTDLPTWVANCEYSISAPIFLHYILRRCACFSKASMLPTHCFETEYRALTNDMCREFTNILACVAFLARI